MFHIGFAVGILILALPCFAQALVPVRDFARKNDYGSAKISPHGEYLAVAKPVDDRNAIVFIDLKAMKISGSVAFSHGDSVADYWWVGPNRVVTAIAKSYGPLDQPYRTGELVAIDADGRRKTYLFGQRGEQTVGTRLAKQNIAHAWAFMLDPLVRDPDHALVIVWDWDRAERDPLLEKINVYDGSRKTVGFVPAYRPVHVVADSSGTPRFAYGADRESECHLFAFPAGGRDWTELQASCGTFWSLELHRMSTSGDSAYLSMSDNDGPTCLRQYQFGDGSLTTLSCNGNVDVGNVEFAFDTGRPVTVTYEDGKPQTVIPDPKSPDARLLNALQNSFKGQRVAITSHTEDGSKLVALVDSDRNPGAFYLVDRQSKKANYLISRKSWIDPTAMQPVETIRYQARDGKSINGYLTAKAGLATKKAPLVLMPHGGPHGVRDYWEWNAWPQLLASRGYAVLQVNYRGSGGYGSAHETAGYRKWGTLMQGDLTDAVKWAVGAGIADPDRVCIFGASYGGYAALMSAVREPDLYRCAISFAGAYDLVTQIDDSDTANSRFGRHYLKRVLGDDEVLLLEQSPITHIARLKAPVLIAHGTADRRVPFSQAKALRGALEKNGKPFEWMEFEGEEHGFYKDENHEAFLNRVLEFLGKHIGRESQAARPEAPGR